MGQRNERVDAYIARQAEFARPILERCRDLVHETCPAAIETIKWGAPAFEHHGLLCSMAAFKRHAAFGFWKHDLVIGSDAPSRQAMGSFGRLTSVDQLPSKRAFSAWMKKAMKLNEDGVAAPREKSSKKKPVRVPAELTAALSRNAKAAAMFEAFPPGCRREYSEWIAEAKKDETRARRVATTIQWLSEGKKRNWKYESC